LGKHFLHPQKYALPYTYGHKAAEHTPTIRTNSDKLTYTDSQCCRKYFPTGTSNNLLTVI